MIDKLVSKPWPVVGNKSSRWHIRKLNCLKYLKHMYVYIYIYSAKIHPYNPHNNFTFEPFFRHQDVIHTNSFTINNRQVPSTGPEQFSQLQYLAGSFWVAFLHHVLRTETVHNLCFLALPFSEICDEKNRTNRIRIRTKKRWLQFFPQKWRQLKV